MPSGVANGPEGAAKLKHRPDRVNHHAPERCGVTTGKLFANNGLECKHLILKSAIEDTLGPRRARPIVHPVGHARPAAARRTGAAEHAQALQPLDLRVVYWLNKNLQCPGRTTRPEPYPRASRRAHHAHARPVSRA